MNYSALKRHILLYLLHNEPVKNVTVLAQEIGHPRPSVSRCINGLGFIKQLNGLLVLSEQGRQEAKNLEDYPYHIMKKLMEQLLLIAEKEHISFIAAYEHDGFLRIMTAHREKCSEIACAYSELAGWEMEQDA